MSLVLYSSPTSPFARKIRIAILELGLQDDVEEIAINPYAAEPAFLAINPLSKIPTLITEDGVALPDSRNILDYLKAFAAGRGRALAEPCRDSWADRRRRQYSDGIIDAAVVANLEQRREEGLVSLSWLGRQVAAVARTLDRLEAEAGELADDGPIGETEISLISALGYLDLRLPSLVWREGRPELADWFDVISERRSALTTRPPA